MRQNDHPHFKVLLKQIEELPSIPSVALKALDMCMDEEVDISRLAKVIESDQGLTVKVLKLVNSVQNALRQPVSSVGQAINLLGLNMVRSAILGALITDFLPQADEERDSPAQKLWSHGLACAVAAQLVAVRTYPELKNEAFVAGMLHDLGKGAIIHFIPEQYARTAEHQHKHQVEAMVAEQELLDTNHAQVGKWLAERWDLPKSLRDVIWLHHQPIDAIKELDVNQELLHVVILGDLLAKEFFCDLSDPAGLRLMLGKLQKILALSDDELDSIRSQLGEQYSERANIFSLNGDLKAIYFQSLQKSNQRLSAMAVNLEIKNATLKRSNQVLDLNNGLALSLAGAHNNQDIFQAVVKAYRPIDGFQFGVIYTVDLHNRILEGKIWLNAKRGSEFLCFLDKEGKPIWDHQTRSIPQGLKRIISSYQKRLNTLTCSENPGSGCITYTPPFFLVPIYSDRKTHGEFCLALDRIDSELTPEESLGLCQTASLTAAAIKKIQLHESLEARSEELSLALWKNQQANLELIQSERLAAVGQLAAGAAHEINNPLAIINARAQLLQLKEKDEKKQKELKQITDQIDRISGILTNLMDFARPAPPKLTLVDLPGLLNKVLDLVANNLTNSHIDIVRDFPKDLPPIKADPNQLEQVFINLIINAQHAMDDQGGTITVRIRTSKKERTVSVDVVDQGEGIPKENLSRIFDPFFTTKEEGKGTGLGLSTSLGIVDNHFGHIDIQSEVGKGTTFTVELPINLDELRPSKGEIELSGLGSHMGNPKILVVDDEEHIREILKETLEMERLVVETAANGEQAIACLEKKLFDLMLIDIRMPIRDGLSLLTANRESSRPVPVIVITGLATHEEMEEALARGAHKCIRKPFHIKALLKDIHELLRKSDNGA